MIKASVGKGGVNNKTDVEFIQSLLNKYLNKQTVTNLPLLVKDGRAGTKTHTAIGVFQGHIVGTVWPDCRVDVGGTTLRELMYYSPSGVGPIPTSTPISTVVVVPPVNRNPAKPAKPKTSSSSANNNTDPRKLTTRSDIARIYGSISLDKKWAKQSENLKVFEVPADVANHKDYNWVNLYAKGQPKMKRFSCNKSMIPYLEKAFANIAKRDLVCELIDFGGCFNIRSTRGGSNWSAHSWALAIDVNVKQNPQYATPKMSKELVACFTDAGFGWGGNFSKQYIDGHHFTLAGFEWPRHQARPK